MLIINSRFRPGVDFPPLQIGNDCIKPTNSVRNLGVIYDTSLDLHSHVNNVTRASFQQLRDMSRIRRCVTKEAAKTMTHAFISSRSDYCNALLYGLPKYLLDKLKYVLHSAARMVTSTPIRDHITPVLKHLHWLPVKQWVEFKILLLTFKALHGLSPKYMSDMLVTRTARGLRSDNQKILYPPKTKQVTYGDRSFSKAAPVLWNRLPLEIRNAPTVDTSKAMLKTHLFLEVYRNVKDYKPRS